MAFILAAGTALLGGAGCDPAAAGVDSPALAGGAGEASGELRSAASRGSAQARRGGGVSILAWNMESFPLTESSPHIIESVLEEMRPDVVAVEEIEESSTFLSMVESMPGYAAVIADKSDGFTRVGVLYRADTVEISEVETLFKDDSHAFPRAPLKVHVTVRDGGLDFDFLALHLKAMMDPKSKARRRAAGEKLERWMDESIAAGGDPDIVLAGDWNDMITKPASDNVFQNFLDATERFRFLTQEVADAGDFSYIPYSSLIDHVMITTPLLGAYGEGATRAVHLEKTVKGYTENVSDHRPVHALFGEP